MSKSLRRLFLVMAFCASLVVCQATGILAGTTGGIDGTITDGSGHAIAGAQVTVVAPSYRAKTVTGANGFYALSGLPPDTYTLTASKDGFQSQSVPGITINQDQVYPQNLALQAEAKTLGRIPVRGSTALVQPTQTVNQYTINSQSIQNITGTPQSIFETEVLNSLPGVTTDNGGSAIIRGGAANDVGFELEGIDATEPITGQFINSLALNGVGRLQLSTGGYDVSEGNTNSGVVNVVAKRGTYPGNGEATATVGFPAFNHLLAFDYGNATPDNRFSYYISYNGGGTQEVSGDINTFYPRLLGNTDFEVGTDNIINAFYHWGANNTNELQYFADAGNNLFNTEFGMLPSLTPYATNNNVVRLTGGAGSGLFTSPDVSLVDFAPLFPGQAAFIQNTNYPDHEDENHQVQKLNYKRQFSASSFGEVRLFRTQSTVNFLFPWDLGAFGDQFEYAVSDNHGIGFDYSNQLNIQHQITFGGETIFTKPTFRIGIPSTTLFTDPLECGQACFDLGLTSNFNTLTPGFSYVQPLYNQVAAFYGLPAANVPLSQLPDNSSHITDPVHRSNLWIKDRWTPTSRLTVTGGVLWDQQVIELPGDANSQNTSYAVDASGNFVDVPGQPLTSDVTRPSQVSPRIALSYELNSRDVIKASYGKFIEFTPISNIENTYVVDPAAAGCTLANGCFHTLPGFSATCVRGVDPANGNVPCNSISNLHQQIIEDLNTNNFAQFTPVRPQRATSIDFSWEHDFGKGLQLKITPYYRKGVDYVVSNTPLLFNLPDGTSVFGSPRESNAGINKNTGVEFALDKFADYGFSGFIHATYDNTLANYDSDFFPSVNQAAIDLGHLFKVSYVSPLVATLNINYSSHNGWHVFSDFPYISGYYYGVGTHTFVFLPTGPSGTAQPHEVLNTDLAQNALGNNPFTSAYYFTDPNNPGTITSPNITGSRGTAEGQDPGSIRGPQRFLANITLAHDIGIGQKRMQVGLNVQNLFGNYTDRLVGGNSRFRANGLGGFGPTSGIKSAFLDQNEPYQFSRGPFPFENEPIGPARLYSFYLNAKY